MTLTDQPPICTVTVPPAANGVAETTCFDFVWYSLSALLPNSPENKAVGNCEIDGLQDGFVSNQHHDPGEIDMKVLICGSRAINDPTAVLQAIEKSGIRPTHIISGGARGVDRLAEEYAASSGIGFTEYLADWDRYGKRAGFIRNCVMIGATDAVIAVWDGESNGTKHSIEYAKPRGKQIFVYLHTKTHGRNVAAHLA